MASRGEGGTGCPGDKVGEMAGQEESSESETETEPSKSFHRRISTNKELKTTKSIKEGYLMKQTSSFQRWRKRYFRLKGRKLYYAKDKKSMIFYEINLSDLSVAERSTKNVNHSFQVITPFRNLVVCADNRKEMEDWILALKSAAKGEFYDPNADHHEMMSGQHNWYASSHARPTYCNVCRDALSGVTSHGLSCEVCKFKAHKRCAVKATNNCKWTTLASIAKDIIEEEDGTISMPHQWLEGNLPVSAKCMCCDKTCGSVLRLQDWRCLWCKAMIHSHCKESYTKKCPLGQCRVSILPPTAINNLDSDGYWEASKPPGTSPLLVFINSKSGDNQGVKMLRRFKQLLNPAQVFDLINGGPRMGLRLFQKFDLFRILVCGGDGSIGWVLTEIDRMNLQKQCQIGVLPLGTGNDLARVLGWGSAFDDDTQLPAVLEKMEHAQIKMLDRWGIMTYEASMPPPRKVSQQYDPISMYEDSVAAHLSKILHSDNHSVVISSAKVLCETVKDFVAKVGEAGLDDDEDEDSIKKKCAVLNEKLDALLATLNEESEASKQHTSSKEEQSEERKEENEAEVEASLLASSPPDRDIVPEGLTKPLNTKSAIFKPRDALMSRANSLKKAVRQIIEHTERAVDEQNAQTLEQQQGAPHPEIVVPVIHTIPSPERDDNPSINSPERHVNPVIQSPERHVNPIIHNPERPDIPVIQSPERDDNPLKQSHERDDSLVVQKPERPDSLPSPTRSPAHTPTTIQSPGVREMSPDLEEASPPPMAEIKITMEDDTEEAQRHEQIHVNRDQLYVPGAWSSDEASSAVTTPGSLSPIGGRTPGTLSPIGGRSPKPVRGGFGGPRSPGGSASRRISSMSTLSKAILTSRDKSPSKETSPGLPVVNVPVFPMLPKSVMRRLLSQISVCPHHPGLSSGVAGALAGGSFISKVLLANADALCAAASPLMREDIDLDEYEEKCVMNNYFGIGLDAKITLEFHNKREEHPEKCRSRTKNMVWYGVIGSKEIVNRTFKNLDQRVQLECDGQRIPLPNLQGIVVLNILSYMGGINFWGGKKENDNFRAPSMDDKILEVVAVFGSAQLGISRVFSLQHHRIAQCRSVKISIMGDEGVPVQVDGEAWIQPPGYVQIVHKNRAQMLTRDKVFEEALKTWTEKQKLERPISPRPNQLSEEETSILHSFVDVTQNLIKGVKVASLDNSVVEQDLFHLATQASSFLERLYPSGKLAEPAIRTQVSDLVSSVRSLYDETHTFLTEKALTLNLRAELVEELSAALGQMEVEMKKVYEIGGLPHFQAVDDETEEHFSKRGKDKRKFKLVRNLIRSKKDKEREVHVHAVHEWSVDQVCQWLDSLGLGEYQENFISHDIRGRELLSLVRQDLKDLGITKVGHLKRIQHSIKDLNHKIAHAD